jgi:hypothetical protein
MGFEPTIPGSERAKTVHALDRSATVTGFDHLEAVNLNNYNSLTELHTPNITVITAHIKSYS